MSDGIAAALARAQQKFKPVKKSKTNPHFKSTYADLADVLAAVVPALNAEGVAVVQPIEDGDLVTRLILGGESIESRVPLNFDCKPQELGSQLTYLRRYSIAALVSVASEDDDDGNAASNAPPRSERNTGRSVASGGKPGTPTEKQVGYASKLLGEVVHHSLHARTISEQTGKPGLLDLNTSEMSAFIDWLLEQKKAGRTPDGDVSFPEGEEPW